MLHHGLFINMNWNAKLNENYKNKYLPLHQACTLMWETLIFTDSAVSFNKYGTNLQQWLIKLTSKKFVNICLWCLDSDHRLWISIHYFATLNYKIVGQVDSLTLFLLLKNHDDTLTVDRGG